MSKTVVCAVRDSAVDAFSRPFFVPSTAMAVRSFRDEVLNSESPVHKHPADYVLYELGVFDEELGRFENLEAPRQLIRAQDIKEVSNASVKA